LKQKAQANLAAIRSLKTIEAENRPANRSVKPYCSNRRSNRVAAHDRRPRFEVIPLQERIETVADDADRSAGVLEAGREWSGRVSRQGNHWYIGCCLIGGRR
jgi:hypothetical protein